MFLKGKEKVTILLLQGRRRKSLSYFNILRTLCKKISKCCYRNVKKSNCLALRCKHRGLNLYKVF